MRRKLYIIGAGGFGREVLQWCSEIPPESRDWDVAGFMDNDRSMLSKYACDVPIVGSERTFTPSEGDIFFCAIGSPQIRLKVAAQLEARGFEFISIIHPSAKVGERCHIGAGSILCPNTILTCDVTVGKHCILNCFATAGHDASMGDGCTLNTFCVITGFSKLGKGVLMGTHSQVVPGVAVGDFVVIGAGSAVVRPVASNTTVLGVPAAVIFQKDAPVAAAN